MYIAHPRYPETMPQTAIQGLPKYHPARPKGTKSRIKGWNTTLIWNQPALRVKVLVRKKRSNVGEYLIASPFWSCTSSNFVVVFLLCYIFYLLSWNRHIIKHLHLAIKIATSPTRRRPWAWLPRRWAQATSSWRDKWMAVRRTWAPGCPRHIEKNGDIYGNLWESIGI